MTNKQGHRRLTWPALSATLVLFAAACGGQPGDGIGGHAPPAGGQGAAPTCTQHGGSQDPELMANWVSKQGRFFNYFVPNQNWRGVETTTSIDISSPTGDADASFGFTQGPGLGFPANLQAAEAYVFRAAGVSNVVAVQQSPVAPGGMGQSQTIEFTGRWTTTGADVHGCLEVSYGNQMLTGYLRMANVPIWHQDALTLRLIRDHITFLPANR